MLLQLRVYDLQLIGEQFPDLCQCANQAQVAEQKMYGHSLYYRREPAGDFNKCLLTKQIAYGYNQYWITISFFILQHTLSFIKAPLAKSPASLRADKTFSCKHHSSSKFDNG